MAKFLVGYEFSAYVYKEIDAVDEKDAERILEENGQHNPLSPWFADNVVLGDITYEGVERVKNRNANITS